MPSKTFSVEITGIDNVIAKFEEMGQDAMPVLAGALYEEAEALITEAKIETPVLTGTLRASGHVEPPKIEAGTVTVECGFGGAAQDYAIYVHENLEVFHEPPTKAKFLEDPFNRRAPGLNERIAQKMAEKLA